LPARVGTSSIPVVSLQSSAAGANTNGNQLSETVSPKSFYGGHASNGRVKPIDISPLPSMNADEKSKSRKRRATHAAELTSTPYKKQLESTPANVKRSLARKRLMDENVAEQNIKAGKTPCARKTSCVPKQKSTAKGADANPTMTIPDATSVSVPKVAVGMWAIVKYQFPNNSVKHYVGRIDEHKTDNNEDRWEMHFVKKSLRSASFIDTLPSSQASDEVATADIVCQLPQPVCRRGIHTFKFDFSSYSVE
jgi:hypothetical protein